MQIINDCVKEGTLLLEVNGVCMNVSDAFIKYEKFMQYSMDLIKSIDVKYGRCCEIANNRLDKIEDKVKSIEQQLIKCCKGRNVIYVYPIYGTTGGIKPIKSIGVLFNQSEPKQIPYDFRGVEDRLRSRKTTPLNPIKNTNYYSPKEKEALLQSIRRVNPNHGREYITSSNGTIYYIV